MNSAHFADWTPARVRWEHGGPVVDWCYLGQDRFVEPFFDQTISRRLRVPFSLLFQQTKALDDLVDLQAAGPGLPPTGFIFHMSRCGSTLAAQLLAALPQNIVISEAAPIDAVLRGHWDDPSITPARRIAWLRALLSAYARPRCGERHFYVKFDCWHTLGLPLIQAAFPTVPWIFLYRDPVQVLVSHQRQRGMQMIPGVLPPAWLGLDPASVSVAALDDYAARVLERVCMATLEHLDDRARLVNYRQLPAAVWEAIGAHFSIKFSPDEITAMQRAAQVDAKNPGFTFAPDAQAKERAASADLRRLADERLLPSYTALESKRKQQEATAGTPS